MARRDNPFFGAQWPDGDFPMEMVVECWEILGRFQIFGMVILTMVKWFRKGADDSRKGEFFTMGI